MQALTDGPDVATASVDRLAGLDDEQRAAVLAPQGPVCVLAGAGTGKTRAVTHRIAHLVATGAAAPQHVLAVTFTARAAGEMRSRLRALGAPGVQARTFHSAALRQLAYFYPRAYDVAMPELVDSKVRLVAEAASRLRLPTGRAELRDLTSEVEWAKSSLIGAAAYAEAAVARGRGSVAGVAPEQVGRLYAAYEEAKGRAGRLDFEDLLLLTAGVLEEHGDVADEVRAQYRTFVVDEYQDVTPVQQRLLDAWLGERDDLTVVGDAAQTIYSFTGASPRWLLDFPRRYPDATVVRLVRDYRSTPQVVGLANAVLAGARSAVSAARVQLVGQRPTGPDPVFLERDSEPEEAREVARRIRVLLDAGTSASEVAVLYRINAQSQAYEAALTEAGIGFLVRGGDRFFDRPEVREAVLLLRGAARGAADDAPAGLLAQVHEALADRWRPDSPPPATARAEADRWANVAAVVRLAEDLAAADAAADLRRLVTELEERAANQHAPTVQGVTLASLHAAKGLEWDAVFIVGVVEGTLPLVHAQEAEELEEERRLLYVGVTRARVHLVLSWALARAEGGRRSRHASRFLDGLLPTPARPPASAGPARERRPATCRVCGRTLVAASERRLRRCDTCPADVDEELFERLRTWRSDTAKVLGQPAFCVFTDATLTAIAEARPGSRQDLLALPGLGAAKAEKFGAEVLTLVAADAQP